MEIKNKNLIEKRNVLNELRTNNMTIQELRFFSIYLSKINSRDTNSRLVRFPLSDFQRIMELGRINIEHLKHITASLLCKVVNVPLEKNGYTAFQLFKECTVSQDENSEWYVEIDAHDKALPLMFAFKSKYFTYQLWNVLRLKSSNQLRMYEILKQYEPTGNRTMKLDELKELLGIPLTEYPRWDRFKDRVLNSCQKALKENTDIFFTYEPIKAINSKKIIKIKFTILKNENYKDPLSLDDFIDTQSIFDLDEDDIIEVKLDSKTQRRELLADACNNEFSESEMQILHDLIIQMLPFGTSDIQKFEYLYQKFNLLNYRAESKKITDRFGYLQGIIKQDIAAHKFNKPH